MVFVLASLGNCATYLTNKKSASSTSWSFDVSYVNVAACSVYIYAIVVPLGFYFLLRYLGSNASLVRFWCMWGYSLFFFVLSSVSIHFSFGFIFNILKKKKLYYILQSLLESLFKERRLPLFFFPSNIIYDRESMPLYATMLMFKA